MEKIPGVPYREVVDKLSLDEKLRISRSIAEWVDQLSQYRFDVIGSFSFAPGQRNKVELGWPVLQHFMGDWRHDYQHERGPFHDLHSFTRAFIDCIGSEMFDPRQRLRAVIDAMRKEICKLSASLDDDDDGACDRTLEKLKLKQLEAEYAALLNSARVLKSPSVDFETSRYSLTTNAGARDAFTRNLARLSRLMQLIDTHISRNQLDRKIQFFTTGIFPRITCSLIPTRIV